jgi:tRNA(fMet)-specific endonuclease VapC
MAYLLDTNHCIYFMNGLEKQPKSLTEKEHNVIQVIRSLDNYETLYMTEVTLGELYYGAAFSEHEEHNIKKIEILKKIVGILPFKIEDWKIFGKTKYTAETELGKNV